MAQKLFYSSKFLNCLTVDSKCQSFTVQLVEAHWCSEVIARNFIGLNIKAPPTLLALNEHFYFYLTGDTHKMFVSNIRPSTSLNRRAS